MCGIAGQARSDGQAVDVALLERMCAAIEHRGPDSRGIHSQGGVGLGIQRLAVIDLRTGDQPIYNEDRSVAVVLNGEIYNFQELRADLQRRGHRFKTQGDTEVIAHLYEEEGVDCVKRLHGMFAFALWDQPRRRLLLARDRIGKKPLLYAQRPGAISFASEMGSLIQDPEISREVDVQALDAYLALQFVPVPQSAFRSIRKLPPGTTLCWEGDEAKLERYWRLTYEPKQPVDDRRQVEEQIREQIRRAVKRRMISDVPLGAFLSGGVDSSAVVAAMAQQSSEPVKTFSIGFEDQDVSELPRARLMAERYATDHHEFIIKPDALELIPQIVRHYGEPFADTSSVPSFCVSRMARELVTVALNGDGGDENFAGYHSYVANMRLAQTGRVPLALRRSAATLAGLWPDRGSPLRRVNKAKRFAMLAAMTPLERFQWMMTHAYQGPRENLYTPEFRSQVGSFGPPEVIAERWNGASGHNLVDAMLEVDFNIYLPDDLCVKIDIATMAYGLEARSPFLDHELMEYAASLPPELKVEGTETKIGLRAALRDWVPDSILDGPKRGFGMPVVKDWFRGELREYIREVLLDPASIRRGYFREDALERLIEDHAAGRADNSPRLWTLMMFELWHREFVDSVPGAVEAVA